LYWRSPEARASKTKITTMRAVPCGSATAARAAARRVPDTAPSPRSIPLKAWSPRPAAPRLTTITLIAHHCQCAPNSRCPAVSAAASDSAA
jgi:hypothetical protein